MSHRERVMIFDTTLRDGEQSPGCSMAQPEKLRVARALADLGVDVIEAGFPAASRGDWESVNAVAREVQGPIICGLARCNRDDIELAAKALKPAPNHRIHVFLATSAIHRQYKLNMAQEEIIRTAVEGVKIARDLAEDVEFSPEDASRTELDFLTEVVEAVIEAGATTVNIPDTVGYTVPDEFAELFRYLRKNVRGIDKIRLSVHCHDDLGMAVANSLTAVVAGARQIECTINGIGERAGNCSLEEVVMALKTRDAFFNLDIGIDTTRLYPTSRMLANIVGVPIPRNKAIVGENAFAHESGIHQHGMLKHHSTYEIMRPQDVGLSRSALVLGKHSGRHALRERVQRTGIRARRRRVRARVRRVQGARRQEEGTVRRRHRGPRTAGRTQRRRSVDRSSICAPPRKARRRPKPIVKLRHSRRARGRNVRDRRRPGGRRIEGHRTRHRECRWCLRKFEVRSVSAGEDAQGEALVYVEYNQRTYRGSSVSTNIVESATQAFLEVINRIELAQGVSRTREERTGTARVAQAVL